uniref:pyridoxal kinase n=1 Tax=Timema monikensis TaxID=170555 RepID=A0A7R9HLC1_9NEOP|nr:unnamed protein product [Timema monikensis]
MDYIMGKTISSVKDAWDAISIFHEMKINTVVLSSTELGTEQFLLGLASSIAGGKKTKLSIKIPRFSASFTGTGDLFAALLLSWMFRTENDLKLSLERTIFTLQAVLKRTSRRAAELAKLGHPDTAARLELQLIQSKADIENPKPSITASEKGYKMSESQIHFMVFYHIATSKKEPLLPYSSLVRERLSVSTKEVMGLLDVTTQTGVKGGSGARRGGRSRISGSWLVRISTLVNLIFHASGSHGGIHTVLHS